MASRGGARPGAGRKKGTTTQAKKDLAAQAREHAEAALRVLLDVAQDVNAPSAARVSASVAILDRGYGKPAQSVALSNPDGSNLMPSVIQIVGVQAKHDKGDDPAS